MHKPEARNNRAVVSRGGNVPVRIKQKPDKNPVRLEFKEHWRRRYPPRAVKRGVEISFHSTSLTLSAYSKHMIVPGLFNF